MSATLVPENAATRRAGRGWIEDWEPENPAFWEATGARVARRNLIASIFAEHLGFSVWMMWSVSAALLAKAGFGFSTSQLFWLVAVPNLVGSLLRLPYTFAVPRFGGRNWTIISALLLVVPTGLFAWFVTQSGTPYWVFVLIAATAGVGGGNFASSMANINHFYPVAEKGKALGLNAAGGNAGVAVVQFFLPIVVGGTGAFGLVKGAEAIHLQTAGYLYAALAVLAAWCAYRFMNNLRTAHATPRQQLAVARYKHTWIMGLLYIGTFGSFMGYSSAMPLLIKLNFWSQPFPTIPGIGIDFAFYAFLGAGVGSLARPVGGMLADRFGGAKVTAASFVAMVLGTLAILAVVYRLQPQPKPAAALPATPRVGWTYSPAVRAAIEHNQPMFGWFLAAFLFVFVATGIANGSAYRMIPAIWKGHYAASVGRPASEERVAAEAHAARESSAVLGFVGAIGAMGGFLIPITFGAPWVGDPLAAARAAFWIFTGFYLVCLVVTYAVYLRRGSTMAGVRV